MEISFLLNFPFLKLFDFSKNSGIDNTTLVYII
jgi:hypothetical protein